MANAVPAADGYVTMLQALIDGLVVQVRLYTNDPDLTSARHAGDFVEPTHMGYAAAGNGRWTPASARAGRAFSVSDPCYFPWNRGPAPLPIRGYFVTNPANGLLLWAWRRPGPAFPLGPDSPLLEILLTLWWPGPPE